MNEGNSTQEQQIAALRLDAARLTAGLIQMAEVQGVHTALLQAILEAATAPSESERKFETTLVQILGALQSQNAILTRIEKQFEPATARSA